MLVRYDLPMSMKPVPRAIHRVQSDVRILSGLQLGDMQCVVSGHATGVGNPILFDFPRYSRCSSVAAYNVRAVLDSVGVARNVRAFSALYNLDRSWGGQGGVNAELRLLAGENRTVSAVVIWKVSR